MTSTGSLSAAVSDAPSQSQAPYAQPQGAFDEAFDNARVVRPHWQLVMENIARLGDDAMQDRYRRAQRILRDDGATYNLNNDPLSPAVWSLDIVPNVIEQAEWQLLERGLKQRSKLFDLIYQDLYGEQRLLKEGIIPSEIIFSHPGFLRQCHGVKLPSVHQLIFHAVDMVRNQDGQFIAIGDRTQAPSGTGYALENRTVVSRVVPSMFRNANVMRLSSFFHTVRQTLANLVSHKTDTPRIVVLTPGAYSSTYFEHAYLANYLGFPLVQGGDLTVRNGKVWMKSLNGLSQVDVILRRMDDSYCDQSELRADSRLGVPGLLEVARNGNVVLANPLGSGVLEAPALLAFLPEICQFLLDQPLQLPSVRTWWCGNPQEKAYVLANLEQLIIKPAYRSYNSRSVYGHSLDAKARQQIIEQIEQQPHAFVAQIYIPGAIAPIWHNGALEGRPSIFRSFTVADKEGYCVMPGGLTRVAESTAEAIVTSLSGAMSKDTWVVSNKPDNSSLPILDAQPRDRAEVSNLPSRVIENLFWFGRYAERAELSLRLMRTIFKQLNGIEPFPPESRDVLLTAMSQLTGCLPGFTEDAELLENPNDELAALVIDAERVGSIKYNLQAMLACGEQVKEMLSADTRIILNELRDHILAVDAAYQDGLPSVPEESLDSLVTSLLALSGLTHESMLRGMDWMFQELGRRTERALQTATLLKATLTTHLPSLQQQQVLESVLLSVEALISFRRRYRTRARIAYGLDLLMIDASNPRSLIYQVDQLRKYLNELPRNVSQSSGLTPENRLIIKSLNDIQLADLEALALIDEHTDTRVQLEQLMTQISEQLDQFTTLLSDKYFDHTAGPQQLIKAQWKADI
ncbi:circularly permuted type 2 ATP-grasp protein [Shewanella sp. C32]|uniref:Circularly permuted type 2 ATP-grasp protein n=1 Tax=Shewanella electrica TaxID=515560 RepID=A0ABT2FLM8_9GAMM|nr:circularly permuted type 2 ATP-grasp protein [Shewanella electrica]MCH1925875.1 circularly permuted type 2 ATP-grasp protein [Shewanella electrica]MCS4557240.1 circularly permuted type 2 ATP-grasp protein [Shewanella electrica]